VKRRTNFVTAGERVRRVGWTVGISGFMAHGRPGGRGGFRGRKSRSRVLKKCEIGEGSLSRGKDFIHTREFRKRKGKGVQKGGANSMLQELYRGSLKGV